MASKKITVLYRKGGKWSDQEVGRLVGGLLIEVCSRGDFPEYLLLLGHFSKEQTLKVLMGGEAYTATQVTSTDSPDLPFVPGW